MHRLLLMALTLTFTLVLIPDRVFAMAQWNDTNFQTAFDPGNRVGSNPVYQAMPTRGHFGVRREALEEASNAGSGNFHLTVPVVSLPGRGLSLVLDLHYNSQVWHGNTFNIDSGWPTAGWSLGFGKIVALGGVAGSMLIEPDGTRHSFELVDTKVFVDDVGHVRKKFILRTTDGSFIDYWHREGMITPTWYNVIEAQAKYPDGRVVDFTAQGTGWSELYPTRITDADGNYITITYRGRYQLFGRLNTGLGPDIDVITDTLGRSIKFHYLDEFLPQLYAITAPGLEGNTRTLIRLHYDFRPERESSRIDAIYYPGSATGYWFGDTDSYSSYGMLAKVSERRAMSFAAGSLNENGTVAAGKMTRERRYNYPLVPDPNLSGPPTYTTMTETWEGMDTAPAVTSYTVQQTATPRRIEVKYPNGTKNIQHSYNTPGQFTNGLVYEVITTDASNGVLQKSQMSWEQGDYGSARLKRTITTDGSNPPTAGSGPPTVTEEFDYGAYNQVVETREYDYYGAVLLRRTHTDYETASGYLNNHIFNLPKVVQVYKGNEAKPVARTEYIYDGQPLADAPGVVQHRETYNPYERHWVARHCHQECEDGRHPPCREVCEEGHWETAHDPATDHRGHITQTRRYTDAAQLAGAIIENHRYNIAGSLVTSSDSCCAQESFGYTLATQYAYPTTYTRGAADVTSLARVTTTASYDFSTGLMLTAVDADGRTTQMFYSPTSLRPTAVYSPTMASLSYDYDDDAMTVTETVRDDLVNTALQHTTWLNGLGQARREATLAATFAQLSLWDIVERRYDMLGRLWQQRRPFRTGKVVEQWTEIFYDALGRVTRIRAPDGSEVSNYFDDSARPSGASQAAGRTVREVDQWGRERWTRTNALGQTAEVIEPNPSGSGSVFDPGHLRTLYEYSALGRLELVLTGVFPRQVRSFRYDSLGRLTHQHLPEKGGTLNDAGVYGGPGANWSDVFTYDERSNLTSYTDARGVKAIYDYANDPLSRLQTITYETSGFGDTANPILPAASVSFQYMTTGDVRRPFRVTAGASTAEYTYDKGRLSAKKLTLASRPNHPLIVDYNYDSLGRLTDTWYPAQYNTQEPPPARKSLHADYDLTSRVNRLQMGGADVASSITYSAAGQIVSLNLGEGGASSFTESYVYDEATGLLTGQKVQHPGTPPVLDLSYDYVRRRSGGRTGQLTRLINNLDGEKNRVYEYDALKRLRKVTAGSPSGPRGNERPYDWTQEYSYDAYGNRTGVRAFGPPSPFTPPPGPELPPSDRDGLDAVSYDPTTNRITNLGVTYDAAGNQTRSAVRPDGIRLRYQYDAAGRLVKVLEDDGGATVEIFTYGAGRQRLATQYGDPSHKRTYYVWDGDLVIAEYGELDFRTETMPQWTKSYVYLGNRLLATLAPGEDGTIVQYHHSGQPGPRLITDMAGTPVSEQETFSFGVEKGSGSTGGNNRRFDSYDRSPVTGLDYAVNRHYDPQQGRFIQVDPHGMGAASLANPQSLSLYTYAGNDPVNFTDPVGLKLTQTTKCITLPGGGAECTVTATWEPDPDLLPGDRTVGGRRGPRERSESGSGGGKGGGGGSGGGSGDGKGDAGKKPQQHRCEKSYASLFPQDFRSPGPLGFNSEIEAAVAGWFVTPAVVVGSVEAGLSLAAIETSLPLSR
jgi:RHS repeat-associated protein